VASWSEGVSQFLQTGITTGSSKEVLPLGIAQNPKKFDDGPMKGRCEFYFILEIFDVSTIFLVCSPNGWFPIMLLF
jgi:hypothetical protein